MVYERERARRAKTAKVERETTLAGSSSPVAPPSSPDALGVPKTPSSDPCLSFSGHESGFDPPVGVLHKPASSHHILIQGVRPAWQRQVFGILRLRLLLVLLRRQPEG